MTDSSALHEYANIRLSSFRATAQERSDGPLDIVDRLVIVVERLGDNLIALPYSGAEKDVLAHARSRVGDAPQAPIHSDISNFVKASLPKVLKAPPLSNDVALFGVAQRADRYGRPVYRLDIKDGYESATSMLTVHGYAGELALVGALKGMVSLLEGTSEVVISTIDPPPLYE